MNIAEKLQTIAENEQKVYNAGYEKGKAESGTDSYYDTFWDSFLQNGIAQPSHSFFAGGGWTFDNFKPKYDMVISNSTNLFYLAVNLKGDMQANLDALGVSIDFSKCQRMNTVFYGCTGLTRIGTINATNATTFNSTFGACSALQTIDKIILGSNNPTFMSTFIGCVALQNITFEGEICDGIGFGECTLLSKKSIENIIGCLSDSVTGKILILSQTAVDNAFETSEGAADGSESEEWSNLISDISNYWDITLN